MDDWGGREYGESGCGYGKSQDSLMAFFGALGSSREGGHHSVAFRGGGSACTITSQVCGYHDLFWATRILFLRSYLQTVFILHLCS
jgi:hypothetical protein